MSTTITTQQSKKLGKISNVDMEYIYASALQKTSTIQLLIRVDFDEPFTVPSTITTDDDGYEPEQLTSQTISIKFDSDISNDLTNITSDGIISLVNTDGVVAKVLGLVGASNIADMVGKPVYVIYDVSDPQFYDTITGISNGTDSIDLH